EAKALPSWSLVTRTTHWKKGTENLEFRKNASIDFADLHRIFKRENFSWFPDFFPEFLSS
ncbi:MAG: hypothetical protein NTZ46_09575, partial [Verrucomicrobia bacterium]|nr:hypothetical protein [Verrucomicrobiota bacterium]